MKRLTTKSSELTIFSSLSQGLLGMGESVGTGLVGNAFGAARLNQHVLVLLGGAVGHVAFGGGAHGSHTLAAQLPGT